jgi:hypothetical protein
MKRNALQGATMIALASTLVSCLGGGGDGLPPLTASCESISGGGSTVTKQTDPTCLFCGVENEAQAADGSLDTFATADAPNAASGQGVSITATIQEGVVFPQGNRAGVFYKPPRNSGFNESHLAISLVTYLDGEVVEQPPAASDLYEVLGPDATATAQSLSYKGFVTSAPFDAIRVTVSDTQGATGPFEIRELCSNGGVE